MRSASLVGAVGIEEGAGDGVAVDSLSRLRRGRRLPRLPVDGGRDAAVGHGVFLAGIPAVFAARIVSTIPAILFDPATTGGFPSDLRDPRSPTRLCAVCGGVFGHNLLGLARLPAWGLRPWLAGLLSPPGAPVASFVLNRGFVHRSAA